MAVVVKPRTCRQCGALFDGGPRAWYCPTCRAVRAKDSAARFRQKGRKADRPLGSTDQCVRCGKDYVVRAARQKYCLECAYDAVREIDLPASRAWNAENKATYLPAKNAKRRAKPQCAVCVVCKKPFPANHRAANTCSPECRTRLRFWNSWRTDYKRGKRKSPPPEKP